MSLTWGEGVGCVTYGFNYCKQERQRERFYFFLTENLIGRAEDTKTDIFKNRYIIFRYLA